jgi:hypothetical protein
VAVFALALPAHGDANRFTTSSGVVTDTVTGLKWQLTVASRYDHTSAANYCTTTALGPGALATGWRLPTARELLSIVKWGASPTIDAAAFPGTTSEEFRTSSVHPSGGHWVVQFATGVTYGSPDVNTARVRCVHD